MSGKTNKLVNQEGRESYYDEAAEGATVISQGDDKVIGADDDFEASGAEEIVFDAARAEESVAWERS